MLTQIRNRLEQEKGKLSLAKNQLGMAKDKLTTLSSVQDGVNEAQIIIQTVAQKTQSQLSIEVSNLVTMALESIFPEPYKFSCNFMLRRGKTECDLLFERNGEFHDPMSSSGGGVIDVASLGLRVSLWSLTKSSRPVIVLDEPMKHLSSDLRPKAAELIKTLSEELGLQIIMITHAEEFINTADKIFYVNLKNGQSNVVE